MESIDKYLKESLKVAKDQIDLKEIFLEIAEEIYKKMSVGGTIFFCGNGGSAADSQHLAAELIGRFKKNREPLKAIALTTDTSIITSTSNDFGYNQIFSRQIRALGSVGDVLIAISTSGESESVINAVAEANSKDILTVCLTGKEENSLSKLSNYSIHIPSSETGIIQQAHITFGQLLCLYLEDSFFS